MRGRHRQNFGTGKSKSPKHKLYGKGMKIKGQKIVTILVFLTVGTILSIYVYDMFRCYFEKSPIQVFELISFVAILVGIISLAVVLKSKKWF